MRTKSASGVLVVSVVVAVCTLLAGLSAMGSQKLDLGDERDKVFVGDPILGNSGGYLFEMPLLDLGGPLPLRFMLRHMDSLPTSSGFPYTGGFQHTSDPEVTWNNTGGGGPELTVLLRNYKFLGYDWNSASNRWEPDVARSVSYEVQETGPSNSNGWYCVSDPENDHVYIFEKNGENSIDVWAHARLRYKMDRNGNTHSYSYVPGHRGMFVETIEDGLGRSFQFQYDGENLAKVSAPSGRSIAFIYEDNAPDAGSNQVIRAVVDPCGGTNTYSYTAIGWSVPVTARQRPLGNTPYSQSYADVTLNRSTNVRVTAQVDAYSNTIAIAYDPHTNRVTETRPDTATVVHEHYRNGGPPKSLRDPLGNTIHYTQTGIGQIASVTDRRGGTTSVGYHGPTGRIEWHLDAEGNLYSNTYTAVSQVFTNPANGELYTNMFYDVTRRDYPDGTYETYATDGRGNVTARVDRVGHTWRYAYDGRGQVLTVTGPEGGVVIYDYNGDATLASRTDSDTGLTTYEYDAAGRVNKITRPDGTSIGLAYDACDRLTAFTNANNQVTTFEYDANGNLVRAVDPAAYSRGYTYDLMDRLTNVTDSVGTTVDYAYDSMGRPVSLTDAAGQETTFTPDLRGWVTNATRAGRSWTLAHDEEGVSIRMTTPLGRRTTHLLDGLGTVTGIVDALDQVYVYDRDAMGRVTLSEDPLGRVTTYEYDGLGHVRSVMAPVVGTASWARNGLGLPVAYTNFNGETWTYGYTAMGRPAAVTNPLGRAVEYSYDTVGRLDRVDYPDGTFVALTRDSEGRVQTRRDRGGFTSSYEYDYAGRLLSVTNAAGGGTSYTRNSDGMPATRTDTDVGVYSNSYDTLRRLTQVTAPDGAAVIYEYDAFNRVTNVVDPRAHARGYEYDADGRLVRTVDPLGNARGYAYDALNRLTNLTDRLGHEWRYEYDAVGNLLSRADPEDLVVEYSYDDADRRTATTVGGQTWRYGYDDQGRLTSRTTPAGRMTTYRRDAVGSVTETVDPMGRTTIWTRDEMQRVTERVDSAGRSTAFAYEARGLLAGVSNALLGTSYTYNELGLLETLTDPNGEDWVLNYTDMGRLATITDPLSRTNVYSYDARGRFAGAVFADGQTVAVGHDAAGNATNRTYADGTRVEYEYDALSRLVGVGGTTPELSLEYDAENRVVGTRGNGLGNAANYDDSGRLTRAWYIVSNGVAAVAYAYDPVTGLLESVEDVLTGTRVTFRYDADRRLTGIMRPNGVNTIYTWDDAGRIVRIREGRMIDLRYTLDAAGQITGARVKAPLTIASTVGSGVQTHSVDAASQLSGGGNAYDGRGRQTAASGNTAYTWNDAGQLIGVSNTSHTTHMTYSGVGDLFARSVDAVTNRFYYNYAIGMKPIISEQNTGGQFARHYVWTPGGALLYMIDAADGNKVYHYHFDRVGSTLALTDAAGTVTDAYAYTPYGRLAGRTGSNPQPFLYVGRYGVRAEGEDGLHHMRARHYDARTGRFLSRDPVWPLLGDPLSLNPYQYVSADPLRLIDPWGTASNEVTSVNIVGYNVEPLPGQTTLDLTAVAFGAFDPSLMGVFGTNQLGKTTWSYLADTIYVYNGSGYTSYAMKTDSQFYSRGDWMEDPSNSPQPSGTAMWVQGTPSDTPHSVTIAGEAVDVMTQSVDIVTGFQMLGYPFSCDAAIKGFDFEGDARRTGEQFFSADNIYVSPTGKGYEAYALKNVNPGAAIKSAWDSIAAWSNPVATDKIPLGGGFWYQARQEFRWEEQNPIEAAFK